MNLGVRVRTQQWLGQCALELVSSSIIFLFLTLHISESKREKPLPFEFDFCAKSLDETTNDP